MWEDRISVRQRREVEAAINSFRNGRLTESQLKDRLLKNGLYPNESEEVLEDEVEISRLWDNE